MISNSYYRSIGYLVCLMFSPRSPKGEPSGFQRMPKPGGGTPSGQPLQPGQLPRAEERPRRVSKDALFFMEIRCIFVAFRSSFRRFAWFLAFCSPVAGCDALVALRGVASTPAGGPEEGRQAGRAPISRDEWS